MPHYENHCNHADEEFVGTMEIVNKIKDQYVTSKFDVYVFADSYEGHHVCVRYGNEPEEYLSPGHVTNIAKSEREIYQGALRLILEKGRFIYEKRRK